jgi:transporter family-2 protein
MQIKHILVKDGHIRLIHSIQIGDTEVVLMTGFIIALISGALMSIQGVFNTGVTKQTSMWVSTGWVQLTAFLTCIILWYFSGKENISGLFDVQPKYLLIGGVMGAFITYTVVRSMGTLGPAKAALIIVISQIIVAYAIELFGLFGVEKVGFEWKKLIGAVVAIIGIMIFN